MISRRRDSSLMMCTTVLHGGVCHRTLTPHKSGNKMKEKKDLLTRSNILLRMDTFTIVRRVTY